MLFDSSDKGIAKFAKMEWRTIFFLITYDRVVYAVIFTKIQNLGGAGNS